MTQAADIVQALVERSTPRVPLERKTGMPYGWALWLRAQPQSTVHARPAEVVELLAQRPPVVPPRGEELSIWPAFFSLFRAGWLPAPSDEKPLRWGSRIGSLVLHLLFVVFLAWVAWMQSLYVPRPPEADGGGERIAVGFVGAGDPGTPQTQAEGGSDLTPGEAPAVVEQVAPAAQSSAQAAPSMPGESAPARVPPPPSVLEQASHPEPEPVQPPAAAEQPVQVTEVESPSIDYVLPPTTPRTIEVRVPVEQSLREREVEVVQAPQVRMPQARPVDIQVRQPRETALEVRTREIDEPLPQVQVREVAVRAPQVEARLPGAPEATLRQREVAMPETGTADTATGAGTADASAAAGTAAVATRTAGGGSAPAAGEATARAPGSVAGASPASGSGWQSSPLAGDDWGQASAGEQRPGGAPGLFDGQGRIRLPGEGDGTGQSRGPGTTGGAPGEGTADRGAPGGDSDTWTRERFEKSGTWLTRPPYGFEPTSFDRYWVPNESLLAEWVRKGMKTVAIPIPGTGKKINCVVSLLQLGGGCGIVDPDLNEQPAQGRPPPDIPFKPELQEDNGSVRPS